MFASALLTDIWKDCNYYQLLGLFQKKTIITRTIKEIKAANGILKAEDTSVERNKVIYNPKTYKIVSQNDFGVEYDAE